MIKLGFLTTRKLVVLLGFLVAAVVFIGMPRPAQAYKNPYDPQYASICRNGASFEGRPFCTGYFTGEQLIPSPWLNNQYNWLGIYFTDFPWPPVFNYQDSNGHWSATGGWSVPSTVDNGQPDPAGAFIAHTKAALYDPNFTYQGHQWRLGAAWLIDRMMGYDGNQFNSVIEGHNKAKEIFDDWADRVRSYAAAGRVNWNYYGPIAPGPHTLAGGCPYNYVWPTGPQASWCRDIAGFWEPFGATRSVIMFTPPGSDPFMVDRSCFNGNGWLPPLEPLPPTVNLKVNGSDTPPAIDVDGSIDVSWTVADATSCTATGSWWSGAKSPSGGTEDNSSDAATAGIKSYGINCSGPGGSASDTVSISVLGAREPYLTTELGSVQAGADWNSEPCLDTSNLAGDITGRIRGATGSKGDYVVSAGGTISNFGSAGSVSSNALKFGDDSGIFHNYGRVCRQDLAKLHLNDEPADLLTPPGNKISASAIGNGIYRIVGDAELTGGNIPRGRSTTLVVQGDVYISSNVNFENTGYSSLSDLPTFGLIASGNIHIDPSVTALYGIYYAGTNHDAGNGGWDPGHSVGGIINTCRIGFGRTHTPPAITVADSDGPGDADTNGANECQDNLRVDGALIANNILFRRTAGDANAGSDAAETISLIPQLLLRPPQGFSGLADQIRVDSERPPVF